MLHLPVLNVICPGGVSVNAGFGSHSRDSGTISQKSEA